MQNKPKKNKKKRELVFKPYQQGKWCSKESVLKGLRLLLYYFIFVFLYLVLGAALQFENLTLRIVCNGMLVLICMMLLYMNGARMGEGDVALGEIAYTRSQAGKSVSDQDLEKCYHPAKGAFMALVCVIPLLLVTIPFALLAQKQVYVLQGLPSWVDSFSGQPEIALPLSYYQRDVVVSAMDILRLIVRVMVFPFANMASEGGASAMLLVDRLSPLLVCLPALGFPLGYLTGPRARAQVHGDINSNIKRRQRRERKARKERAAKKNELI